MKPFWKILLIVCVLAAAGGFYWWKTQPSSGNLQAAADKDKGGKGERKGGGRRGGAGGPVPVRVVTPTRQAIPVIIDTVGTVESEQSVVVRPQVNGTLQAVLFKEGDFVKQGQLLFRIDPRPMQAAVEQAEAAVARDRAQLAQAREQEARLHPLLEKDYITRQDYDVAATQVKALEATSAANLAVLDQAKLQLAYSQINAPISGRTGGLTVKAGNLVTSGNAPVSLVVINSIRPILVSMTVPQQQMEQVRRYWNTPDLKALISPAPGAPIVAEGPLVFMDNTVNVQTGTILLKARMKNEKEQLWPGEFVACRIVLTIEKDALVLPESAVQPGQNGAFVYVVRDGKAAVQKVHIERQVDNLIVIDKGLKGDEQVAVDVSPALAEGSVVQVRDAADPNGKDQRNSAKGAPNGDISKSKEIVKDSQ